jgi:hypothetical protein
MNVRRGRTPFDPVAASLRDAAADSGQMFSTICDAVSFWGKGDVQPGDIIKENPARLTDEVVDEIHLPLRLPKQTRRRAGGGTVGSSAVGATRMHTQLGGHRAIGLGKTLEGTRAGPVSSGQLPVRVNLPNHIDRICGGRRNGTLSIEGEDGRGRGGGGGGNGGGIGMFSLARV